MLEVQSQHWRRPAPQEGSKHSGGFAPTPCPRVGAILSLACIPSLTESASPSRVIPCIFKQLFTVIYEGLKSAVGGPTPYQSL